MRRGLLALLVLCCAASIAHAQKEYGFDNTKPSGQPYLKPEESVKRMKVADGFEVKLFAAEPMVVNPIAMTVDEKGRVWVIECFEYPSRTPKGKMPRDRIVILEDTDGDGVADKRTVFCEGKDFPERFDLASGLEVGHGGVFVGAPPYLWFIENKNDKPGKFTKLLSGFGSEDTHETLNTFQWGPDGRLYGLHGVFTQSNVSSPDQPEAQARVKLNAGVWRYDVREKKFEIFAEGTSNPWGMDWRNTDGQFILCCCVIPHLFHIVPGGIYKRQAGQSNNPYAYSYLNEICDHTFHKESGWAHAGLISLDTPIMPKEYRDSVIFGSIHGCSIKRNVIKRNGSTFIAGRADDLLQSGDKNFRPINLRWGPNGEIYCIDWHDQNPCHQAAAGSWDYEHGRVYRIQTKGLKTKKAEDLGTKSDEELAKIAVADRNPWRYRQAMRMLQERTVRQARAHAGPEFPDKAWEIVKDELESDKAQTRLRALWVSNAIHVHSHPAPLKDSDQAVRAWAFRLGYIDPYTPGSTILKPPPAELASAEKSPVVRRELTSAILLKERRLNTLPLVHALMEKKEDAIDPTLPQLIWLAYEGELEVIMNFESYMEASMRTAMRTELDWLRGKAAGNQLITDFIIPRSMRRLVATDKPEYLALCLNFVGDLKDGARTQALSGLVTALDRRTVDAPPEWTVLHERLARTADEPTKKLLDKLAVAFRDPKAMKRAYERYHDAKLPSEDRVEALRQFVLLKHPDALATVMSGLQQDTDVAVRLECARSLRAFDDPRIGKEIVERWPIFTKEVRGEILNSLASRKEWAKELLKGMADKKIDRMDVRNDVIMRIQAHKDKALSADIEKVWGKMRDTPAELAALIDKMRGELYNGRASFERGRKVFENQCSKCHQFEGKGHEVGPVLDGAGRDIEYLLVNVLDPNRVIGRPYYRWTIALKNGTVESGILHAEDGNSITLKGENAVLKVIPKKDIEEKQQEPKSLMPEGLDKNMTVQDFRDLVRYVMANPFLTDVQIAGPFELEDSPPVEIADPRNNKRVMTWKTPVVGVHGRIQLPPAKKEWVALIHAEVTAPEAMKTRLLIGGVHSIRAFVNGKTAYNGKPADQGPAAPDQASAEVELKKGVNRLIFQVTYKGEKEAVYARLLDPQRRLRYPETALKNEGGR
jgi:putative membrane-bound dehydrogenase-like protein